MKKGMKKLSLNRDTMRNLSPVSMQEAAAGAASFPIRCSVACTPQSCGGTCNTLCTAASCYVSCTCPSLCPCPV